MPLVTVGLGGTQTITSSETDIVSFLGIGTLNVTGTAAAPIDVTLGQIAGVGALDTINISNATVTVNGLAGVSALLAFNIGAGGRLNLASTLNVAAGSTVTFNGANSVLGLGGAVNLSLLNGIAGFAPGSAIDVGQLAAGFTYADAPGNGTGGIITLRDAGGSAIGTLPLLTGEYTAASFQLSPDSTGGTLVSFPTTITAVSADPATADLGLGQTATLMLATSVPVTVAGGTPTLSLNDGGTAVYNPAASMPSMLAFTYAVGAGENTPDLAVTAANLNGATITNGLGVAADLTAAAANPAGILQVDTIAPTVAGVTTLPGSGALGAGQTVAITVGTSEPVTVTGGTPTLSLSDGGTATYNPAASTPTALVFNSTVTPGQNTPDLTVTALNPNGATIADLAGNPAVLTGAVTNPAGVLAIDTTAPTVSGVTTTPGAGTVGPGSTVAINVGTTEPVTVAGGTPTLTLNDGGVATYDPGASTPTNLVFTTTIAPGQTTPDLTITAINPNGATITDPAGNPANLGGAITNPPGVLGVDTTAPQIVAVLASPATADLGIGQVATITIGSSEPVTVANGTPTLSLNDGGVATYSAAGSTPTALLFTTTVAAGQNAADLAVTAANLNGATIADAGGNALSLAPAVINPPGILQIDGTVPTIGSVTTNPASGSIGAGQAVAITLNASEPVAVAGGTPTLTLNDGGTATYNPAASTPTALVFTTTVTPGQNAAGLAVTAANLNGATITDPAGNPANLAGALGTLGSGGGSGGTGGGLTIDTTPPTITGVTTSPSTGPIPAGTPITITVGTSEPVTSTGGPPTLSLGNGGTAAYVPGASTPTGLVFTYTPAPGDDTPDLTVSGLNLNGGSLTDAAGNSANLAGSAVNPPGVLQIDTSTHPFLPLVVTSADTTGNITIVAATRPLVAGTYSNLGIGTLGADGATYTVSGTLAQVNAALAGVTLSPAKGSAPVAGFTASVTDTNTAVTTQLRNTSALGSAITALAAGDAVAAGTGGDTLSGGTAARTLLLGGGGADVLVGSTAGSTLLGGTGSSAYYAQGGSNLVVGAGARDVVATGAGTATVFSATSGRTVVGLSSGAAVVVGRGADTIIGSSGTMLTSVATGGIEFTGSGAATTFANQGSTVVGGTGSILVGVRGTGAMVFGGTGPTTFIGGTGSSTVIGGAGGNGALFAGQGGGFFSGGAGGNNTLVGGMAATTLFGGGSGDVLFAVGGAGTVLRAGSGNETLQGALSSGNDTFYTGSGNTLVGLGAGQDVVFAGSGSATVVAGTGQDLFAFVKGQAGGTESIIGFKAGTDKLVLGGYDANEAARATAGAVVSAGSATAPPSTTITLSDNTRIILQGTGSLPANLFG